MGQVFGRQIIGKEAFGKEVQHQEQGQQEHMQTEGFTIDSSPDSLGTMIQTPFINASTQVNTLVDELKEAINENANENGEFENENANGDSSALLFKHEVLEMKRAARAHDVMFEEEEANAQAKGKKTRRQTLQEFILLFFYCSYAILSAAIVMYAYIEKGSSNALGVAGMMVVLAFVITGFIIRLA